MTVQIDHVKCACADCVCVVEVTKGVARDGRIYCADACADHHADDAGCHHAGCTCHG